MGAAAAVGANASFSGHPNLSSLSSGGVVTSCRVPSPTSCHFPSSGPRAGLLAPAISLGGAGLAIAAAAASACVFPPAATAAGLLPFQLQEPGNALSLPTWAIHVSSVVEWSTAMALVWQYGDKSGLGSWKGLSWGMEIKKEHVQETPLSVIKCPFTVAVILVPLLGGAFCACTWHFFYNSESLEVLVTLQAALTVLGNLTMCIAAYRIYKSSQRASEKS